MLLLIWLHAWRDMAQHKARTLLAVLSIAVGVFALGLALGALDVMRASLEQDRQTSRPADLTFRGGPSGQATFYQDFVDATSRRPGVAEAEGESYVRFRWKLAGEIKWRNGVIVARADYAAQIMGRVELLEGNWPALTASRVSVREALMYE